MSCRTCGRALLPFHEACFNCGHVAQSPEAAAARKVEWDALSPKTREQMQEDYEKQLAHRQEWLDWLQANRRMHAVWGAVLYGLPVAFVFGMIGGFPLWAIPLVGLFDLAVGAGLGFALNRMRGGEYRGMLLFGGGFIVESAFRGAVAAILGSGLGGAGIALMMISGFLISLCAGYAFGLQLTLERTDVGA